jgi:hypothetical protein
MKSLSETYMGTASAAVVDTKQAYRLSHALTEIEIYIITMRKSIKIMKNKIELKKKINQESQSAATPATTPATTPAAPSAK